MVNGWDCATAKPGTVETLQCRVCGAEMDVTRDVVGPTSWATSVGKIHTAHDSFFCPHREEEWHKKVLSLKLWQTECPSERLNKIVENEIADLLIQKSETKHGS